MFGSMQKVLAVPYVGFIRRLAYKKFKKDLKKITSTTYSYHDAMAIRMRIYRQKTNLITAILYKDVPLTNNLAERQLRPMVVSRKISGGSRSPEGAKTHAVNMSIFQSIRMRHQPLVPTLKGFLLSSLT